jgi:hypothetical protein
MKDDFIGAWAQGDEPSYPDCRVNRVVTIRFVNLDGSNLHVWRRHDSRPDRVCVGNNSTATHRSTLADYALFISIESI